jgi:hypothetical protein
MKNDKNLEATITKNWRIRRVRGGSDRYSSFTIEYDYQEGDKHTEIVTVAMVHGQEDLAQAFRALPEFITAAVLSAFRIQSVLDNAKGVLEGHRAGLREAQKLLLDVLDQAGMLETLKVLKKIPA